uniref:Uncharacterized protein n=1 Tax=viral metagenome TaxID=1070528 RepID=A0A6M3IYD6_9ZZZZ
MNGRNNSMTRSILVGILILVTVGWIGWVSASTITASKERIVANQERILASKEREILRENIGEIKDGVKRLTDYFMISPDVMRDNLTRKHGR